MKTNLSFVLACLFLANPAPRSIGQTTAVLTTIYTFSHSGETSTSAALAQGTDGNFYGTTTVGGTEDEGTVFQLTPAGVLTTIHSFTDVDGSEPGAALTRGSDGNFYGTTIYGGANNFGTVFQITPAGTLTTLYQFSGTDGYFPNALTQGADGSFYGVTTGGGASGTEGHGTIYKITAQGALTTLHDFTGAEGSQPSSALLRGSDGNFYGLTPFGGTDNSGTVFQITPAGAYATLYNFTGGTDGGQSVTALAQAGDGTFYGTTKGGSSGDGTIFTLTTSGVFTTLYTFAGTDGQLPSTLVLGNDGNFYGTTEFGGTGNFGTLFQLTPPGVLTTLYDFDAVSAAGIYPSGGLLLASDGYFYGTTLGRAAVGMSSPAVAGTVYRVAVNTAAGTVQFAAAATSVNENAGSVTLVVHRLGSTVGSISVNYSETDGTALAGIDYQAATGQLTWADGDATDKTFTVLIIDRGIDDGNTVTFSAELKPVTGGGNVSPISTTLVNIFDDAPSFFAGQASLGNGVYYLAFSNGNYFGYYSYLSDPAYIYHFDLGYEYVFDAADGDSGVYLYDFTSSDFFYTSPVFPFPYLFDFDLDTVLYYYPDPNNTGHYNTNGARYFFDFATGQIITK